MIIDLMSLKVKKTMPIINFDLTQYKTSMVDFFKAFENSILKRTRNIKHGIFIGISSGYDSGAIACALHKLGIKYTAYSIIGSEDPDIIDQREKYLGPITKFNVDRDNFFKC